MLAAKFSTLNCKPYLNKGHSKNVQSIHKPRLIITNVPSIRADTERKNSHWEKLHFVYLRFIFTHFLSDFQIHCGLEEGSGFAILGSMKMISVILRVCTYVLRGEYLHLRCC